MVFVEVYNYLGVGLSIKAVSAFFKNDPEFRVIEDLAVKNNPLIFIFVVHGLPAAFQVYNAQSGVGKARVPVIVKTESVGTAMAHCRNHVLQQFHRDSSVPVNDSGYSAHIDLPGAPAENDHFDSSKEYSEVKE